MIELGKKQKLLVVKTVDFGISWRGPKRTSE